VVAAGHVTTLDTNVSTNNRINESTNNFCRSQLKPKKGERRLVAILNHTLANTPFKFFSCTLSFLQDKRILFVFIQRNGASLDYRPFQGLRRRFDGSAKLQSGVNVH